MAEEIIRRVIVAGGSGLLGQSLVKSLLHRDVSVLVLSRRPQNVSLPPGAKAVAWEDLPKVIEEVDAVVNLAGEGIADERWTCARKEKLLQSRVGTTLMIVEAIAGAKTKPKVLVNASAIGIYGPRNGTPVDERDALGKGFLAKVCKVWEATADEVASLGVRTVKIRIGVVLSKDGGALPKITFPIKIFQGTRLGTGHQGFSWIHIDDLTRLLIEACTNPNYTGPFNATSPRPVTNETITRHIAKRLHRPIWPVPAFVTRTALKVLLGEMAEEMLLQGAFVYPRKALELGFQFKFEQVEDAIADLL